MAQTSHLQLDARANPAFPMRAATSFPFRCLLAFSPALSVVLTPLCHAAPPRYSVVDLGASFSQESHATGVNDLGMVTGYGQFTLGGPVHAFLYSGGVMQDLGSLGASDSF